MFDFIFCLLQSKFGDWSSLIPILHHMLCLDISRLHHALLSFVVWHHADKYFFVSSILELSFQYGSSGRC